MKLRLPISSHERATTIDDGEDDRTSNSYSSQAGKLRRSQESMIRCVMMF
jgi:hypothetical protein